jgi:diacylglycerol O-acyltransferase / wax synthase
MAQRLRTEDLALLAGESATAPAHIATLEIFEPAGEGFDYDRLVSLIGDRIAFVPRYRQRLRTVPGLLVTPVWVDDDDFDLTFHVRRSALPRPGSMDQLRELVARIESRRLDRASRHGDRRMAAPRRALRGRTAGRRGARLAA